MMQHRNITCVVPWAIAVEHCSTLLIKRADSDIAEKLSCDSEFGWISHSMKPFPWTDLQKMM